MDSTVSKSSGAYVDQSIPLGLPLPTVSRFDDLSSINWSEGSFSGTTSSASDNHSEKTSKNVK